jgi:glycosyltransferase involved in cell wall biosynthesis/GT2 family glycosyltransferase
MVLMASFSGEFGGAERLLINFAATFEGRCCVACPPGGLADAARTGGLTVFTLPRRRLHLRAAPRDRALAAWRLLAHGAELRRLAAELDPELVIAWGMRSAIALAMGPRPACPVVFQHNDLLPGPAIARAVRAAARRASVCVALSEAIARDLDPGGRVTVVNPGIDVERFDPSWAAADPHAVLTLGALTAWKRPDLAIEAIALARRERPELTLRLVGAPLADDDGALVAALRDRAAKIGPAIALPGAVPDPAAELARAGCVLHCAEREPFGMAVLEAIAAGRPVIAPAAAGPAEIVDESCGILYPPGDARAAARALVELAGDPDRAAAMGAAGRQRARRRFGLERARAEYARAVGWEVHRAATAPGPAPMALVTVTRNSAGELAALLRSVELHLPGTPVVVVDCASSDGTLEVARACPLVRLRALDGNVGFGRGSNLGLELVPEPVTALINPDVELVDGSLATLAAAALDCERLLAPLILYPDGSRQDSVQPPPGSVADLVRSLLPPALLPGRLGVALAPWRARSRRRVGWAVGAALVARTASLRRLGPFDERLFLYGEDLDLGLRAAEAGIETWFWPAARIVHHRAHASAREFGGEPFEALARARHEVIARRRGPRAARRDDRAQALTFRSRAAIKRALRRPAERESRQLEALGAIRRDA